MLITFFHLRRTLLLKGRHGVVVRVELLGAPLGMCAGGMIGHVGFPTLESAVRHAVALWTTIRGELAALVAS
jgi:hypothetical protein